MTFSLLTIPEELDWKNAPRDWRVVQDNSLVIPASEYTDWFIDPGGNDPKTNAPAALFMPTTENFLLKAKVEVNFAATFDAGVLMAYIADDTWAKLCFEYSPQKQPMIVSVVTRGLSDDCNAVAVTGNQIYLRVGRQDRTIVFHYSEDGYRWHLVRYFTLGDLQQLQVGFSAQSPTGKKCTAVFSEIGFREGTLNDIRSGE